MNLIRIRIALNCFLAIALSSLHAQSLNQNRDYEISTGFAAGVYQSIFSLQSDMAFETAVRSRIGGAWDWQIGARLGLSPMLPEGFVRILAAPAIDDWHPTVGFELGVTRRSRFDGGDKLLSEMRTATEQDISPYYVAFHTAPLSFHVWERWRISMLEFQIGTHLSHIGRTMRAQVGLVSVGVTP